MTGIRITQTITIIRYRKFPGAYYPSGIVKNPQEAVEYELGLPLSDKLVDFEHSLNGIPDNKIDFSEVVEIVDDEESKQELKVLGGIS